MKNKHKYIKIMKITNNVMKKIFKNTYCALLLSKVILKIFFRSSMVLLITCLYKSIYYYCQHYFVDRFNQTGALYGIILKHKLSRTENIAVCNYYDNGA